MASGAGFGFPVRFKIEASNDSQFATDVSLLVDRTGADVPNPGTAPQQAEIRDVDCFDSSVSPPRAWRLARTTLFSRWPS